VVAVFWALTLGIAYGYAVGAAVGIAVGFAAFALAALGLARASAAVVVDADGLAAGAAYLPWAAMGSITVLDASAAKDRRGPGANPRAYLLLRGWIPTAVTIGVVDARDPTPYWFVSTRSPERLADALQRARQASGHSGTSNVTGSGRSSSAEEGTS
jgi:hypothetical protein